MYNLEEILSFNLIYRMLGIDSGITEKTGSRNSISEWRTFGMADVGKADLSNFQNSVPSEWRGVAMRSLKHKVATYFGEMATMSDTGS